MFEMKLTGPAELQSALPDLVLSSLNTEHQSAISLTLRKTRHALPTIDVS